MKVIKSNFQKEDCKHFKWVVAKACCNRTYNAGVCTIADVDGNKTHKTCQTTMPYCRYEKENVDVHTTELSDLDRRDGHSN